MWDAFHAALGASAVLATVYVASRLIFSAYFNARKEFIIGLIEQAKQEKARGKAR